MQNWMYALVLVITVCCFGFSLMYFFDNRVYSWDLKKYISYPYFSRRALLIMFWPIGLVFLLGVCIKMFFQIFSTANLFDIFKR